LTKPEDAYGKRKKGNRDKGGEKKIVGRKRASERRDRAPALHFGSLLVGGERN